MSKLSTALNKPCTSLDVMDDATTLASVKPSARAPYSSKEWQDNCLEVIQLVHRDPAARARVEKHLS